MTKTIWTGTCSGIVALATAAVTAQTPAPPQSGSATSEQNIVLTGCLTAAPPSPTDPSASAGTAGATGTAGTAGTTGTAGTAGTAGAAGAAGATGTAGSTPTSEAKFLLTKAVVSPTDSNGAAGPSAATQTYRLIANSAALAPLVGKKLELTGTLDKDEPSAGPALRVKSGKIVAASCSE
jgi:hypothetical protein